MNWINVGRNAGLMVLAGLALVARRRMEGGAAAPPGSDEAEPPRPAD